MKHSENLTKAMLFTALIGVISILFICAVKKDTPVNPIDCVEVIDAFSDSFVITEVDSCQRVEDASGKYLFSVTTLRYREDLYVDIYQKLDSKAYTVLIENLQVDGCAGQMFTFSKQDATDTDTWFIVQGKNGEDVYLIQSAVSKEELLDMFDSCFSLRSKF